MASMIFLAGSLAMNGGSTFLLRIARQLDSQKRSMTVVVLSNVVNEGVRAELERYARIVMLDELLHPVFRWVGSNQIAVFLPNQRAKVAELLESGGQSVHVMGIYGLLLALRWSALLDGLKISVGVYHQNEFMFASTDYFGKQIKHLVREIPGRNMVFFNEGNRRSYSNAFGIDYSGAAVLPIGINVGKHPLRTTFVPGRLVSIGNLETFKKYNEYIINIVAELRHRYPFLIYDIYGTGPNQEALARLALDLGVQSAVRFHGQVPYAEFSATVTNAHAFIGSGTALLEAAEMGVPSIVGIESIAESKTYGYISDVPDLVYNELVEGRPLIEFRELIKSLLDAPAEQLEQIGRDCARKAKEFSIDKTVDGLITRAEKGEAVRARRRFGYWTVLLASFLGVVVLDRLGVSRTLRDRRNQSTIA